MGLDKNLFRNWVDGEPFSARDYVYERDLLIDYANALITEEDVLEGLFDDRYYNKAQLDAGQLDNLYFRRGQLAPIEDPAVQGNGALDERYFVKTEVGSLVTAVANRASALESKFANTLLTEGGIAFNQNVTITSNVEFSSVKLGTKTLNQSFITGLEDKYTKAEVDNNFVNQDQLGVANGVATLGGDGKLSPDQVPLDIVVFKGTFGSAESTTGGDLPSNEVSVEGDFYICDMDGFVSTVAGKTFDLGDKAVFTGTAWSKIDNTESVTSVNGLQGAVVLDFEDVGAAPLVHTHVEADITNLDKYTQGEVNTLLAEKSDTGHSHFEVDIVDLDKYTQDEIDGFLLLKAEAEHTHIEADIIDLDKYTQQEVDTALATKLNTSLKGAPNGLAELDANGHVPANQLPSFVDDVLEYPDFSEFPTTGQGGKIYVAKDTGKVYRWGVSQYIEIAANEVNSVNGKIGVVTLGATDIGVNAASFNKILNTDDTTVQIALQTIDGHTHTEADITNLDKYTQAQVDTFLTGKANSSHTHVEADITDLDKTATAITYSNTNSGLQAENVQAAVDELEYLIQQNTTTIRVQKFIITNPDNGNGTFSYTYNGQARTGSLTGSDYEFLLENDLIYIVGENRVEVKVNNDITFYSPDAEMLETAEDRVVLDYPFQANDEVFFKVYQGLDSVALVVPDGTVTTAKLSGGLQNQLTSYTNHVANASNPHGVTKTQVGLGFVTNDQQVKADTSGSVAGNIPKWLTGDGDALDGQGYGVTIAGTALADSDQFLVTDKKINELIGTKQDTLVSGTNIKTVNGASILGSGNYEIDIPAVSVSNTPPVNASVGDLWWNSTNGILYIWYNDGSSSQWVAVSYADVESAINALVANAPEALNTLNELAAALGNDANFATTVATELNLKATQADLNTLSNVVDTKANKLATFQPIIANRILELADANKVLNCTNSSGITITVPLDASVNFPIGTQIAFLRNGTGTVTFEAEAPAGMVIINSTDNKRKIKGQYSSAAIIKIAAYTWQLVGNLEA